MGIMSAFMFGLFEGQGKSNRKANGKQMGAVGTYGWLLVGTEGRRRAWKLQQHLGLFRAQGEI